MASIGSPVGNIPANASPYQPYRYAEGTPTSSANWAGGSDNNRGKLWLPIWSGEVIRAYDEYNIFEGLVTSKTIASGRSMEFPITGTVSIKTAWNAGEELVGGQDSKATGFSVSLDSRPIAAHFETDNIDLMISQWEYRSELARQAGLALSNARDKQIYSMLVRCGATTQLAGDPRPSMGLDGVIYGGGDTDFPNADRLGSLHVSGDATQRANAALELLLALEKFVVHLQENNIDAGQVFCAVNPQAFMDIRALGMARASTQLAGGGNQLMFNGSAEGGFAAGLGAPFTQSMGALRDSLVYMGVNIIKTNHMLTDDQATTNTIGETRYGLDFAAGKVGAVIFTSDCIASLKLQGVKVDTVDDIRRNTQFTVASTMNGTGVMRPECCALFTGYDMTDTSPTRGEVAGATYLNFTAADGGDVSGAYATA